MLLDLASHHVDLIRWMLKTEVAQVSAAIRSDVSEQDSATVTMELLNDADVQSFFSFRSGYADRIDLIGESGTLSIDRHRGSLTLQTPRRFGYGSRRRMLAPEAGNVAWRMRRFVRPAEDPSYHAALKAFANGRVSESASMSDGERSLEVILAAEQSGALGEPVPVTRI